MEIRNFDAYSPLHKSGHTSKGDQLKWKIEDRHTNNIAVIYNEETQKYELSPFFDQGLSMFADINQDYPIDQSLEYCLGKIEAKPFSSDFDIQLDAAEELYGIQIGFQFTFKDIQIYLQKNSENYPREVIRRVEQLLRRQMRKYGYLMKNDITKSV